MTMNILLSNEQQVLFTHNWLEKLKIKFIHLGNDMSENEIVLLSAKFDINTLLSYSLESKLASHIIIAT